MRKGELIEVEIYDLAFGGAGVGKVAAGGFGEIVVFVEGAVPGDLILCEVIKIKKNFIEARIAEIKRPSNERINARCKHFGVCGGCSLQFLDYENQLKRKEKMVYDAMRRLGELRIDEAAREPILRCAGPWFYRNKMEYSFGANTHTLGLHPKKNFRDTFDLEECFLESPDSVKIARAVRRFAAEHGADYRTLTVREGKNTGELMINLATGGYEFGYDEKFAAMMRENFSNITSLYHTSILQQKGRRTALKEK